MTSRTRIDQISMSEDFVIDSIMRINESHRRHRQSHHRGLDMRGYSELRRSAKSVPSLISKTTQGSLALREPYDGGEKPNCRFDCGSQVLNRPKSDSPPMRPCRSWNRLDLLDAVDTNLRILHLSDDEISDDEISDDEISAVTEPTCSSSYDDDHANIDDAVSPGKNLSWTNGREDPNEGYDLPPCPISRGISLSSIMMLDDDFDATNSLPAQADKDQPPRPFVRMASEKRVEEPVTETREAGEELENKVSDPPHQHIREKEASYKKIPTSALARLAEKFTKGVEVKTHTYHLKAYPSTFIGKEAVDFMLEINLATTREDAVFLGRRFFNELNLFHHVLWDHTFKDGTYFYRFTSPSKAPDLLSQSPISKLGLQGIGYMFEQGISVRDHVRHFKKYKNTFTGEEACDFLVREQYVQTRKQAVFLGHRLLGELGLFHNVSQGRQFKDRGQLLYRFSRDPGGVFSTSEEASISDSGLSMYSSCAFRSSEDSNLLADEKHSNKATNSRSVSFGSIQERLFERSVVINPSTSSGPSIGLGWAYTDGPSTSVLDMPISNANGRRSTRFRLSGAVRKKLLLEWGHAKMEIYLATRMKDKIRDQRKRTLNVSM